MVFGLTAVVGLAAVAQAADRDWISTHYSDHPLVGSVWTGDGEKSSIDELKRQANDADFVLLGEIHPNPDHHRIQAEILGSMTGTGRKPALVFEMIPDRYQDALDGFAGSEPEDAQELGALVDWEERGWPKWSLYRPVADIAVSAGLPLVAGDIDKTLVRKIGMEGRSALTGDQLTGLSLVDDLPDLLDDRLREILRKSHCDLLPEAAIGPMTLVQRARDGAMAAAMLGSVRNGADGAVLIAGSGHVRNDFAVPAIVRAGSPDADIISVGMMAVDPESVEPEDYVRLDLYDFVLFTPREDLTDHCSELSDKMKSTP